jgi:steroid 5-alpha reductase family enzyme
MRKSPNRHPNAFIELLGWYGVLAILTGYALTSLSLASPHAIVVILLNGTGAAALIWHSVIHRDTQLIALNAVWFVIALFALFHVVK